MNQQENDTAVEQAAADAPAMPENGAVGTKLRIPARVRIVEEPGTIVFVGAEAWRRAEAMRSEKRFLGE